MLWRLCSLAPRMTSQSSPGTRRIAGTGIDRLPERYCPVIESFARSRPFTVPGEHDVAAVLARARADVDHVVGDPDRLLVVLDDEHRVAEVAQAHERVDEPAVVALVQPDRRLVEHVEHADEAAADLGGEPDALRLAAGERAGRPDKREVVEPDVEQEAHAGVDLLDHPLGDHAVALGQLERGERLRPPRRWEAAEVVDVAAVDRDGERQRLETRAAARGARHLAHVALDLLAGRCRSRRRCGGAAGTG